MKTIGGFMCLDEWMGGVLAITYSLQLVLLFQRGSRLYSLQFLGSFQFEQLVVDSPIQHIIGCKIWWKMDGCTGRLKWTEILVEHLAVKYGQPALPFFPRNWQAIPALVHWGELAWWRKNVCTVRRFATPTELQFLSWDRISVGVQPHTIFIIGPSRYKKIY
jgi:hypothetical protein